MPGHRRSGLGRALQHAGARVLHRMDWVGRWVVLRPTARNYAGYVPMLPMRMLPRLRSPARPWTDPVPPAPEELRTQPGIRRNPAAEELAARDAPLKWLFEQHPEAAPVMRFMWPALLSAMPRLVRATDRMRRDRALTPAATRSDAGAEQLRARMAAEAARIGLSAVGVAAYDPKYTFVRYRGRQVGDRIVVGVLEQNFGATQRIPALAAERAALNTYGELVTRLCRLADWLRDQGYRARVESYEGESMFIHYAVAAGLGQLGLNGQLLTPHAGSRCRLGVLSTDAPLPLDSPVDYGIEGLCDRCQICVRRCPVGAIPRERREHRGITKAKLNTKRCLPIVAQADGCAVCMKVCPVQRYGLARVHDEFAATGRILGKDTDDLEGYDWPLDGRHYPPGSTPRVPAEIASPPGYRFIDGRGRAGKPAAGR